MTLAQSKLSNRRSLAGSDTSGGDLGAEVVFPLDRRTRQSAEHRDLSDMRQRVCDRALEELLRWKLQRQAGSEIAVESLQAGKKPLRLLIPGKRLGIVPCMFSLCQAERPIEQVAYVSQDLPRSARLIRHAKLGKSIGRAVESLRAPIGERGQSMAQ